MKEELIELGQYLISHQLAWGNSGNISVRTADTKMMITSSGTYMGNLGESDFSSVDIGSGEWTGIRKPSKEVPMHTAIYQQRSDVRAIIHSSPFWTTLIACSDAELESRLFVESMYYVEKVSRVEYHHPGSYNLGDAVMRAAAKANIIILKNHGVIVYDDSIEEAKMRLETLEMLSKMILVARQANVTFSVLDDNTVKDFLENSGYKPRKNNVGSV